MLVPYTLAAAPPCLALRPRPPRSAPRHTSQPQPASIPLLLAAGHATCLASSHLLDIVLLHVAVTSSHRTARCQVASHGPPRVAWFDRVLADIGDNQSLQQSLSTFSGHVRRIKQVGAAAAYGGMKDVPQTTANLHRGQFCYGTNSIMRCWSASVRWAWYRVVAQRRDTQAGLTPKGLRQSQSLPAIPCT